MLDPKYCTCWTQAKLNGQTVARKSERGLVEDVNWDCVCGGGWRQNPVWGDRKRPVRVLNETNGNLVNWKNWHNPGRRGGKIDICKSPYIYNTFQLLSHRRGAMVTNLVTQTITTSASLNLILVNLHNSRQINRNNYVWICTFVLNENNCAFYWRFILSKYFGRTQNMLTIALPKG